MVRHIEISRADESICTGYFYAGFIRETLSSGAREENSGRKAFGPPRGLDEVVAAGQTFLGRLHTVEVRARQVHQPVG